jgi:hypothetical protein
LAEAQCQGLHNNNINQKYSGIGYYRIKRLQEQQHDSNGGGGKGSLAAVRHQGLHNNNINQKYSGIGYY